jgi:hypothetical protein
MDEAKINRLEAEAVLSRVKARQTKPKQVKSISPRNIYPIFLRDVNVTCSCNNEPQELSLLKQYLLSCFEFKFQATNLLAMDLFYQN